jgi:hypothetical protein
MKLAIKSEALNSHVATYVVAYKAGQAAVSVLRDSLLKSGIALVREELRQPLMHSVAMAYGVQLQTKVRGEGVTWLKDTVSGNASQCHQRLMGDLFGAKGNSKDEFEVPADMQAVADKLVKLAREYDKKFVNVLIATALANAKAAK